MCVCEHQTSDLEGRRVGGGKKIFSLVELDDDNNDDDSSPSITSPSPLPHPPLHPVLVVV